MNLKKKKNRLVLNFENTKDIKIMITNIYIRVRTYILLLNYKNQQHKN